MKKLFALLFLLVSTAASAQQCPNRPVGDVTNACANTRFVATAISNISIVINTTPITGAAAFSGGILFNNSGVVSNTDDVASANLRMSGSLTITPPTTTSGLLITNLVTGGPYAGALLSNVFTGSISSIIRGNGAPGTSTAPNWALVQISGSVNTGFDTQNNSGAGVVGQAYSLSVGMVTNAALTTRSDLVAGSFGFSNNFNVPNARGYAVVAAATVGASGNSSAIWGLEAVASVVIGGTVIDRAAVNLISYEQGVASRINSAISVQRGNPGGEFSAALTLNPYQDGITASTVLTTTGDVIYIPTAQTINSIINAPTAILAYVYNTLNTSLTGAGIGVFGSATSAGAIVIAGAALDNISLTYKFNAVEKFQLGATATGAYWTKAGAATPAISVDFTTNIPTLANGVVITTIFTATGLVKNADLVNTTITVNGTVCTLGSSCTPTGAGGITALTGDGAATGPGSVALTLATVNSNVGTFGSATQSVQFTVNAKGLLTAAANVTITPALGSITGFGTGIATALAVNVGSAGAPVLFNGAGGTPTSIVLTNGTGLPLTGLAQSAANTMLGNWTGSTANVVANTMPSCADSGGNHLNYLNGTGVFCGTSVGAAAAGTLTGTTLAAGVTASSLTSLGTLVVDLTISKANAQFVLNNASSGQLASVAGLVAAANRNILFLANSDAESGSNAGSNIQINRYNDAGSFLGTPFKITRSSGAVALPELANSATTSAVCFNTGTGVLTYNSTVGTCTVSVLAAKNIKAPLTNKEGFDIVNTMQPYRYDMKPALPTYTPGEQIGFVAEWTKDNRLVAHNADGSAGGFRYEQYTAALTAAFKYLKADNDNLRQEVEKLRANR